jgi:hypothetical protein
LHVHGQLGVLIICAKIVGVLNEPLSVSPRWHHHVATVLRCRAVGPAGSPLLSEVTIVYIDNVDAAMVWLLQHHHLLILFASNEFTLPVRCVRPRIWILLVILILLEQHHTLLPTGHYDLLVI